MSPPIAHCWCNAAEEGWSSPCHGIYSAGSLLLVWDKEPYTQVPHFPKIFLSVGGRSSVWRYSLTLQRQFWRQEWWSNEGVSSDFGEASSVPISAPTLCITTGKLFAVLVPDLCNKCESTFNLTVVLWYEYSSCPMTGSCDDRKGNATHWPQKCYAIRWGHPERMFSFPRLWIQGCWREAFSPSFQKNNALTQLLKEAYEESNSVVHRMKKISKQENWQLNVHNALLVLAEMLSTAWCSGSLYP